MHDFDAKPWLRLTDDTLGYAATVPSMLTKQESKLYYWLANECIPEDTAIVDLGAFVGGSTARLAQGAKDAGRATQIHAFDRFEASDFTKERQLYAKGIEPFEGTDIKWLSEKLLAPYSPNVHLHTGDITVKTWTGGKIGLLALDASKTAASMDLMAKEFFPHLVASTSYIVQQDCLLWSQPWIPVQMEVWADHFTPLAQIPADNIVYRCDKVPTPELLKERSVDVLTDQQWMDHIKAARERLKEFGAGTKLTKSIQSVRQNPGHRRSGRMQEPK